MKIVLAGEDGLAVRPAEEVLADPQTLTAFDGINYV